MQVLRQVNFYNFSILVNVKATKHCRSLYLSWLLICFIFIVKQEKEKNASKGEKKTLQIIYIKYIILLETTFLNAHASPEF